MDALHESLFEAGPRVLMADETYVGGLRELLGNFRPRALLILDEAALRPRRQTHSFSLLTSAFTTGRA